MDAAQSSWGGSGQCQAVWNRDEEVLVATEKGRTLSDGLTDGSSAADRDAGWVVPFGTFSGTFMDALVANRF